METSQDQTDAAIGTFESTLDASFCTLEDGIDTRVWRRDDGNGAGTSIGQKRW